MNPRLERKRGRCGITLLEVMILMAILAVLGVLLFQNLARRQRGPSKRIQCVNNLKQIGLATRLWAMDHGDTYPPSTAMTNGGTLGHPLSSASWVHYQVFSNELYNPRILICPADPRMKPTAGSWVALGSNNVSYFFSLDAEETSPSMWLAGDRNLTTNSVRIPSGLCTIQPNLQLGWDGTLHKQCGNLGLADASVQQLSSAALQQSLQSYPQTNRLAIP